MRLKMKSNVITDLHDTSAGPSSSVGDSPNRKKVAQVFLCFKEELRQGGGTTPSKLRNLSEEGKALILNTIAHALELLDNLYPLVIGVPEVISGHDLMDVQFIPQSLEAVAELLNDNHLTLLNADKYRGFLILLGGELQ